MNIPTPNEMQIQVNKLGYEVIPTIQDSGKYKVILFLKDKCYGLGRYEYKCWKIAMRKTYKDLFIKYILKK